MEVSGIMIKSYLNSSKISSIKNNQKKHSQKLYQNDISFSRN